jgi:hypothetical protein
MKSLLRFATGGGSLFLLAFLGVAPAQDFNDDDDAVPDGVEILTRGPLHEAFAQPNDIKSGPGQAIQKEPPAPIPEEPPEDRPEGDNVQFIPGYWAWDVEENRFLWVSGGYRNAPVGRQWVPGYWTHTDEGWRWVHGMWADERQDELRYVPEPPAPLETEPSLPPTAEDSSWVPGNWVYRDTRFVWRPGYWSPYRADRVWVAPRYNWTPIGYTYNDGYWDYPLEDCGLLFAPVYFHQPFWNTAGWFWRPWHVVNFGLIYDSCFTHHGFSHFYFGNYYGSRYHGLGYRPWFHGHGHHHSAFAHHRWHHHRHDHNWYGRQRDLYRDRHDGRRPGPPRTWADQRALVKNKGVNAANINQVRAVAPLKQAKALNKNVNLVKLTAPQAETQKAAIRRTQEIAQARSKQAVAKGGGAQGKAPTAAPSFKLPPAVRGTETVRPKAGGTLSDLPRNLEFSSKKKPDGNASGNGNDRGGPGAKFDRPKGINPPVVNNAPKLGNQNPGNNGKPRVIDNPPAVKPKGDTFKPPVANNTPRKADPSPPRFQENKPPQPKGNNLPKNDAPKSKSSVNFDSPPRFKNPSPLPKVNASPGSRNNDVGPRFNNPAPKVNPAPPKANFSSPPRNSPAPRFNNPAPKVNPSPPRANFSSPRSNPAPTANFNAPRSSFSAPRAAPQSPPRNFSPARSSPAPRASSAPAQRSAPAGGNSSRSGGGGQNKSKGKRN